MGGTSLVGRAAERERLIDALTACRSGSGRLVLVSGEAGIGKSRLVADALTGWDGRRLSATARRSLRAVDGGAAAPSDPALAGPGDR